MVGQCIAVHDLVLLKKIILVDSFSEMVKVVFCYRLHVHHTLPQ